MSSYLEIKANLLGFTRTRHICEDTGNVIYDSFEEIFRESPIPKVKRKTERETTYRYTMPAREVLDILGESG